MENKGNIDFVITWVDGNDPAWIEEKARYTIDGDGRDVRFRDWDLLRYWFRGVEANAPWVRKIHFVTWGHLPEWLNVNNPKLNIVKHEDFIPERFLPTFNSHTIELNLHRIEGLSDTFVYFNDDMFLIDQVPEEFFFKEGLPCDAFQMSPIYFGRDSIGWINGSNTSVINDHFRMRDVVKKNWKKVFSPKNGIKKNIKNLALSFLVPWFPGLDYWHITSSFLKETFEEVWEIEPEILEETCRCRFREKTNVSPFLMKDWQLVTGRFMPMSLKTGKAYHLNDKRVGFVEKTLERKSYKIICINDTENLTDWEDARDRIKAAFEKDYSGKCSFEL